MFVKRLRCLMILDGDSVTLWRIVEYAKHRTRGREDEGQWGYKERADNK